MGVCRIYFVVFEDAPFLWLVDSGVKAMEIKCPRVVMAGSFETGVVVVIDWTPAASRNRELHGASAGEL
jgi:hypothetical protein